MQTDCYIKVQVGDGLHPTHSESPDTMNKDAKMMIGVPEKYALEVSSPTPIGIRAPT